MDSSIVCSVFGKKVQIILKNPKRNQGAVAADEKVQPSDQFYFSSSFNFNISQIPSDEKIQEKLNYSGIDKLEFENVSLRKKNKHTQIDFSAIAKGWGVDQISHFLDLKKKT